MEKKVSPLAMLRKIRGDITQDELGQEIGVSGQTVGRWERGDVEPSLKPWQVKKLCKFLNITIDELPDSFAPQPIIHNCVD
jgi:DNA-binding XRE family transcriptional regulator